MAKRSTQEHGYHHRVGYRKLEGAGMDDFGSRCYYGAATTEAVRAKNQDVYIIEVTLLDRAMYLSRFAKSLHRHTPR